VGWSEFIEASLRNECLSYGAALVYTMVQAKNTTNIDVLYNYLMHRLYDYPLKQSAKVPSRDALFVPSGWDSRDKVDAAASQLPQGGLDHSFESVVISTEPAPPPPPPPVQCEGMQNFLKFNSGVLNKLGGGSATAARKAAAAAADPGDAGSPAGGRQVLDTAGGRRSSGKLDAAVPGAGGPPKDNATLEKFFRDLLKRGQGSTSTTPGVVPAAGSLPAGAAATLPVAGAGAAAVPGATAAGGGGAAAAPPPATSAPPAQAPSTS